MNLRLKEELIQIFLEGSFKYITSHCELGWLGIFLFSLNLFLPYMSFSSL